MPTRIAQLLPQYKGDGVTLEMFLDAYPRKAGKPSTKANAWNKLNGMDQLAAMNGINYHLENNPQWRDKVMIPHPATYLNGRRWEDEIVIPRKEEIEADVSDLPKMVWSALSQMFGESFRKKHGDTPPPIWINQLKHKTARDVQRALRHLMAKGEEHPPSLPHFIFLCRDSGLPEFKSLPKPESDGKAAEAAFAELRSRGII